MPRLASPTLTDAELRIMSVLWGAPEATITEIISRLGKPTPVRATVQSFLRILERKRYVVHRVDGRSFVYRPVVDCKTASGRALEQLLARFFGRSPRALVLRLLEEDEIDPRAARRVRALLGEENVT